MGEYSGSSSDPRAVLGPSLIARPGFYWSPAYARGTTALTIGEVALVGVYAPAPIEIDRIAIAVTTAGAVGTLIELGAYDSIPFNGIYAPDRRLFTAGTVVGDATGHMELSVSQVIPAGLIWLAALATVGTPTIRSAVATGGSFLGEVITLAQSVGTTSSPHGYASGLGNTVLPSLFDRSGLVFINAAPIIAVRAA